MGQVSAKLRRLQGGYGHWCPGCGEMHHIPDAWTFNGNVDIPTFAPSVKHTCKQKVIINGRWVGGWVCGPDGRPLDMCCHYFIRKGRIEYCGDCTHALSGQTIPLPDLPDFMTD